MKTLRRLVLIVLTAFCFALTSCDDDDNQPAVNLSMEPL